MLGVSKDTHDFDLPTPISHLGRLNSIPISPSTIDNLRTSEHCKDSMRLPVLRTVHIRVKNKIFDELARLVRTRASCLRSMHWPGQLKLAHQLLGNMLEIYRLGKIVVGERVKNTFYNRGNGTHLCKNYKRNVIISHVWGNCPEQAPENYIHSLDHVTRLLSSFSSSPCTYLQGLKRPRESSHRPKHLALVRTDDKHALGGLLRIQNKC